MKSIPEAMGEMHIIRKTKKAIKEDVEKFKYEKLSYNRRPCYSVPSYEQFNRTCQWLAMMEKRKHTRES